MRRLSLAWSSLTEALRAGRAPGMALWRVPVALAWFTVALCALLALPDVVRFAYRNDSGIYAWVSANRYPKQQEMVWFLSAVAGVPAVMLAGWCAWWGGAGAAAGFSRNPPVTLLRAYALWHLPLLVAWPRLVRLQADAWKLLPAAAGVAWVLAVATALLARFLPPRFLRAPVDGAGPHTPAPDTGLQTPVSAGVPLPRTALSRGLLRGWRLAVWLLGYLVVPGMFYLMYVNPGCDGTVDLFHEGEFLIPLDELLRGAIPYRDVYLQHGLFHNAWIPWLGAKLFGPTLLGVRIVRAYVEPLGYIGVYYLILTVCRTRLLPAAFLAAVGCSLSYLASPRSLFGVLSVTVIAASLAPPRGLRLLAPSRGDADPRPGLRGLTRMCLRQGWPLLTAGGLAMLAFWHSVEVGLYALAAAGLFLAMVCGWQTGIRPWRRALPPACYLTGATAMFLPIGVYLGVHGALDDLARNVWIQCAYQTDTWGLPFPAFLNVFRPLLASPTPPPWPDWLVNGNIQYYYGPIALSLAAAFLAFRAMGAGFWQSRTAPVLLLVTLTGSTFFRTALGRSDGWHIQYGFLFALVLALFLADRLLAAAWDRLAARGARISRRLLGVPWLAAGLAAAAGVVLFVTPHKPLPAITSRWARFRKWPATTAAVRQTVPRAGRMVIPAGQAEEILAVAAYIRDHTGPEERVFDFSSQAGFLFFADRRGGSRYFQVCYASLPDMQLEVMQELDRLRPGLVLFRAGTYFDAIDRVPASKRHPLIASYLRRHYEPADTVGRVVFWRRRAEAARLYGGSRRGGRVEDADGGGASLIACKRSRWSFVTRGAEEGDVPVQGSRILSEPLDAAACAAGGPAGAAGWPTRIAPARWPIDCMWQTGIPFNPDWQNPAFPWVAPKPHQMEKPLYTLDDLETVVRDFKSVGGGVTFNVGIFQEGGLGADTVTQLGRLARRLTR